MLETVQPFVPVIGGLLALSGAIITFLNSRLNEAKTPDERKRLWQIVVVIIDGIAAVGAIVSLWLHCPNLATILAGYHLGYSYLQFSRTTYMEKRETEMLMHALLVAFFVTQDSTNRRIQAVYESSKTTIEQLEQRLKVLEGSGSHVAD